jgi:hypothetical protein
VVFEIYGTVLIGINRFRPIALLVCKPVAWKNGGKLALLVGEDVAQPNKSDLRFRRRVARWYTYSHTKIPIWVNFVGPRNGKF